jgi:hypothetical protein
MREALDAPRRHPRPAADPQRQDRRPGRPSTPEVIQIETAMGAAIEVFEGRPH